MKNAFNSCSLVLSRLIAVEQLSMECEKPCYSEIQFYSMIFFVPIKEKFLRYFNIECYFFFCVFVLYSNSVNTNVHRNCSSDKL